MSTTAKASTKKRKAEESAKELEGKEKKEKLEAGPSYTVVPDVNVKIAAHAIREATTSAKHTSRLIKNAIAQAEGIMHKCPLESFPFPVDRKAVNVYFDPRGLMQCVHQLQQYLAATIACNVQDANNFRKTSAQCWDDFFTSSVRPFKPGDAVYDTAWQAKCKRDEESRLRKLRALEAQNPVFVKPWSDLQEAQLAEDKRKRECKYTCSTDERALRKTTVERLIACARAFALMTPKPPKEYYEDALAVLDEHVHDQGWTYCWLCGTQEDVEDLCFWADIPFCVSACRAHKWAVEQYFWKRIEETEAEDDC